MNREVARLNQVHCPPLGPGQEWWTSTTHEMTVRLRDAQRRGEVQVVGRVELAPGVHGALVNRLRPRRPEWQGKALTLAGVSLVALAALMLVRLLILPLTVVAVVMVVTALWGGLRRLTGHRAACAGLHCSGCQR